MTEIKYVHYVRGEPSLINPYNTRYLENTFSFLSGTRKLLVLYGSINSMLFRESANGLQTIKQRADHKPETLFGVQYLFLPRPVVHNT